MVFNCIEKSLRDLKLRNLTFLNMLNHAMLGHALPFPIRVLSNKKAWLAFAGEAIASQLHPVVFPHVLHFRHVPLRTSVKFPHSSHASPS